jgi:LPS sulfotransferase NodH
MSFRNVLFDDKYDYPTVFEPNYRYAIVGCQRCRSTLLCLKLWETMQLGAPWEYFMPGTERWGKKISNVEKNRTSPNGVFGVKSLIPGHYEEKYINDIIFVTRNDEIERAVSEIIAQTSETYWSPDYKENKRPEYDENLIYNTIISSRNINMFWENFFKINPQKKVLRLEYNDIPNINVDDIFNFLNIKRNLLIPLLSLPKINNQYTDINKEWVFKFKNSKSYKNI